MGSASHNTWHLEGVETCLMWSPITAITNAEQYNNKECGDIEMFTVQSVANDKDCIRLARSWLLVLTIGWRSRLQLLLEKYTRRNITSTEQLYHYVLVVSLRIKILTHHVIIDADINTIQSHVSTQT